MTDKQKDPTIAELAADAAEPPTNPWADWTKGEPPIERYDSEREAVVVAEAILTLAREVRALRCDIRFHIMDPNADSVLHETLDKIAESVSDLEVQASICADAMRERET